jgi:hypothetical protein
MKLRNSVVGIGAALVATAVLAAVSFPPVTVIGTKARWALDMMILWEDLREALHADYAGYSTETVVSDDPQIASNNTDGRCNSFAKAKQGTVNWQSPAGDKKMAALAIWAMLKGHPSQGGLAPYPGGFADFFSQMGKVTYIDANGTELTGRSLTITWALDGSTTTVSVFGTSASTSYVRDVVKSDPAPPGQYSACPARG